MELVVECQVNQGMHVPQRFNLGAQSIEVVEIIDRWIGSENQYFKVVAGDGSVYILRQDGEFGYWELTFFEVPASYAQTAA